MDTKMIRRLLVPSALFLLFAGFTLLNFDLLLKIGSEAVSQSQRVFLYIVQIGIWLSAAHFLNRLITVFFWDGLAQKAIGAPVPRLLKDVFTIIFYIIAVTGIVRFVFKQPVTGIWATSGVMGLILGFALRNMILDVFTGISINIDRSYKIGDWIMVHGSGPDDNIIGQIIEINWRTTKLYTEDDSIIVLPNSLLGTKIVTNFWGAGPESRFETTFCLDFSIPTERASRILLAGAKAAVGQKGIMEDPEPHVIVNRTIPLGIEYKVRFWMTAWGDGITEGVARSHITISILNHLKQAGITPAYPKQDLFYAEMPSRHLDTKTLEDHVELLSRTELFEYLTQKELKKLASDMVQKNYIRGDKIIQQGATGDSMFILSEGLLHAFLRTNENEAELKVGQIIPGEFFGEMSLLTGEPRSTTIVAITDVKAHEITKDNMNVLLSKRPDIAETISKIVAERRIQNSEKMATATQEEKIEETKSLAKQILTKMKSFFKGVFEIR